MRLSYISLFVIVFLAIGFTACEKGLETYHGDNSIYFTSNKTKFLDTGFMTFGYSAPTLVDSIISIPVSALGIPSGFERPIVLTVADSSTAKLGVHYEVLAESLSIPAGAVGGSVKLKLHRTAEMQNTPVFLVLQLQPNEHFQTAVRSFSNGSTTCSAISYKLWASDIMTQPAYWSTAYMGTFSRKKIYLTANVLGLSVQEMISTITNNNPALSLNSQLSWGRSMKLYLNQQAAAGTPVYEDDGTLMKMGDQL